MHTDPSLDLGPAPSLAPQQAPPPPPAAQPAVLRVECTLPTHACQPVHARGRRQALPVLVRHDHGDGRAKVRLYASKPWEISRAGRRAVLLVFESYGALGLLDATARAMVEPVLAEFHVPAACADAFVVDVLAAVTFEKAVP